MAFIRIRSPNKAPPVLRLDGSTETIANFLSLKSIKKRRTNSSTNDDLMKSITNEISLPLGFPLLCKLARGKSDETLKKLIKENLQGSIRNMEARLISSLLMTLICGGKLHVASLVGNACPDTRMQECFTKLKSHYESSKVDNAVFDSAVRSLVGSYLVKSPNGQFEFIHHAILEATFKTAISMHIRVYIWHTCTCPRYSIILTLYMYYYIHNSILYACLLDCQQNLRRGDCFGFKSLLKPFPSATTIIARYSLMSYTHSLLHTYSLALSHTHTHTHTHIHTSLSLYLAGASARFSIFHLNSTKR